jgi:uncharacterized protein (TIGR02646 family)
MRLIVKNNEPVVLSEFRKKYKGKNHNAAQYDDLPHEARTLIRDCLLTEQYGICAYCMSSIKNKSCHIEHIKPRSRFPGMSLDYGNLVASCESGNNCGKHKGNKHSDDFVAPTEADCESHFSYTMDGRVIPLTDRANYTIKLLNLNSYKLKTARKTAIISSGIYNEDFDTNRTIISNYYSHPNTDGWLPAFCMAVTWAIENY